MGKTALGTNMAFHAARAYVQDMEAGAEFPRGAPVLFFSLEMAAQQLSARILSEQTEIEMWKIRNGKFSESEWEKFVLTMQDLSTLPLYIDDTGGISIAQIAARARRLKREKNIGLIIIDYLQLVEPSRRHENRVQEITEVTKGLKTLAKELNVPDPGPVAAVARRRCARRQAPGAVGLARIRLHRAGRRRGDVRLSRGILPEIARARSRHARTRQMAGEAANAPPTAPRCWWKSTATAPPARSILCSKAISPASATWRKSGLADRRVSPRHSRSPGMTIDRTIKAMS